MHQCCTGTVRVGRCWLPPGPRRAMIPRLRRRSNPYPQVGLHREPCGMMQKLQHRSFQPRCSVMPQIMKVQMLDPDNSAGPSPCLVETGPTQRFRLGSTEEECAGTGGRTHPRNQMRLHLGHDVGRNGDNACPGCRLRRPVEASSVGELLPRSTTWIRRCRRFRPQSSCMESWMGDHKGPNWQSSTASNHAWHSHRHSICLWFGRNDYGSHHSSWWRERCDAYTR